MSFKICVLNKISSKGINKIKSKYSLDKEYNENIDAMIVRSAVMHGMNFNKNLKFIGRAGTGVNNIPIEKCSEKGIVVCNAPGANANAVKEIVVLGMLMSSRNIFSGIQWVNSIRTNREHIPELVEKEKSSFSGPELHGKKMGVVGLGAIGVLVSNIAVDLGMEVHGYDPYLSIQNAWSLSRKVNRTDNIEFIFENCDYVSIHIPYNKETKNVINEKLIKKAKKGMRLLNFSRNGLIDNDALATSLEKGIISNYICDFPEEATLKMKNTINIPHLGASTPESEENSAIMTVDQMIDFLENGNISNSINFPNCNMGKCNSYGRITIAHKNIPNMIGQITTLLAEKHINISDMTNKNRGKWAYTMIDIDNVISDKILNEIEEIDGVTKARLIVK